MPPLKELGLNQLREALHEEWDTKWNSRYESLGQLQRAEFFLGLTDFTNDVFLESEMFQDERNILGEDKKPQVLAAVMTANFNDFDTLGKTEEYKTVLKAAHSKERFKREIILDFLDHGNTLGLKEEERIVVHGFMEMANVLDDISLKWRDEVVWSDTGRKISALTDEQKVALPVTLTRLGLDHKYAFLRHGEGADFDKLIAGQEGHGYFEVLQMEAQRAEYMELSGIIRRIVSQLGRATESPEIRTRYLDYFQTWNKLAQSTDVQQAELLSEELDLMWMLLLDDLLVTHPMEYGYYGDDGMRKDVMARIDMMDPRQQQLIDACNAQKQAVYEYLSTHPNAQQSSILLSKIGSLAKTRFLALAPISQTMGYDFKPAGESLPNSDHQTVTDALGKRVLVFLDGCDNSWKRREEVWKMMFNGTEFVDGLQEVDVRDWIVYILASHETGETVSRDADTENRMGFRLTADLNENKADVAGLARYGELAREGLLTEPEMVKLAKLEVASLLFFLSRWGVPQVEPYHKDGIITANIAIQTGLLREDRPGHWLPNFSKAREFLAALTDFFWQRQVPVWESKDPAEAQSRKAELIDDYLTVTPEISSILRVVSKRYSEARA